MRRGGLLVCLTAGATLAAGCAPSIDAAAKADVDARIANLRAAAGTIAAPARDARESMPLAVGQWAKYKMTTFDGQPKILTQKIVAEEGGAFWFELVHDTYQGRTVEQLLVAVGDRRHPAKVELREVRKKDARGHVITLSRAQLWVARNGLGPDDIYWDDALAMSRIVQWSGLPQQPTVVPAGHFEGCYRRHVETPWRNRETWVQDSWSHPAVPLSGLVRMKFQDPVDGQREGRWLVSELAAYGTTGARSEF
jgi:hypothetical protein